MNYLKRTALVLFLFIVIIVIVSLFLPSTFKMERSIVINGDKEQVFKQINDLKNWKNWSPWEVKDLTIYSDGDLSSNLSDGVVTNFSWDSDIDIVGSGKKEITQSIPNEQIEFTFDFGMGEVIAKWNFNDVENGVEVVWGYYIDFGFSPLSKYSGMFMEAKVAPDYELGLELLKSYSESLPKINQVDVVKEEMDRDLLYLSVRDTIDLMEMNNVHGKIYSMINNYMDVQGIVSREPPLVIYHAWTDTIVDIELGIPVLDSSIIGHDKIKMKRIMKTNVVKALHYGAYDRLPETYFGINEWMRKNKVVVTGPPWEFYITDPATEPNPEKWETAIYFPVE